MQDEMKRCLAMAQAAFFEWTQLIHTSHDQSEARHCFVISRNPGNGTESPLNQPCDGEGGESQKNPRGQVTTGEDPGPNPGLSATAPLVSDTSKQQHHRGEGGEHHGCHHGGPHPQE